jgi:hypothetical protein
MLIKLIGRYFDISLHSYFPGLVIEIIAESVHFLGKHPSFRHKLYNCVKNKEKTWKAPMRMSLDIPSSPGAFFELNFFKLTYISSLLKASSSAVSGGA